MSRVAISGQLVAAVILLLLCGVSHAQSDAKNGSATKATGSAAKGSATKGSDSKKSGPAQQFDVADGQLKFSAPGAWKKIQPKFDFYHAEFNIPKADGDEKEGRITFSQVGGSIDQNLDRWEGQFVDIDTANEEHVKKEKATISGLNVQMIRIAGTFQDGAGPFAPKTKRADYVLIGAAIEMEKGANVYIKSYGPKKTMAANAKVIKEMIKAMKVVD